ncbi:MAG: WhiB family transcriptional regulator, partial [Sporichthyaceae bacterium]
MICKEVTPMQLAALDDVFTDIERLPEELPCRVNDPELFFAESPADVEYA